MVMMTVSTTSGRAGELDLSTVRAAIPALKTCVYLNTAGIGPSPQVVTDEIVNRYQFIGENTPDLMAFSKEEFTQAEATRSTVARFWKVDEDEVALLRSTAEGFNIVGHGLRWQAGDEIISCGQDHPAARSIWTVMARRHGVVVRRLDLVDDAEAILRSIRDLLTPRTRLISLSHVTSENGLRVPAREICRLAHEAGVRVILDGTQAVGQIPLDLREMDCDFYVAGSYKWLLGPFGTGALYIRRDLLSEVEQALVGAGGSKTYDALTATWEPFDSARRYEFGARHWPLYPAMAAGIRFVESVGLSTIEARSAKLVADMRDRLRDIPGVIDFTPGPAEMRTGMLGVAIKGMSGAELADKLRGKRFLLRANRGPADVTGVRICLAFFTSDEEVEATATAIAEIARSA
jgi:L-cysteine/cystine lyase